MYRVTEAQVYSIALLLVVALSFVARMGSAGRGQPVVIYFFLAWSSLQYFLSPVITYCSGGWAAFLLFPQAADEAVGVAMAFVASVVLGYLFARATEARGHRCPSALGVMGSLVRAHASRRHLLIALTLTLTLHTLQHLLKYGGLENLFFSELARGAGGFQEKDLRMQFAAFLTTLTAGAGAVGALILGLRLGSRSRPTVISFLAVLALLCVCGVAMFEKFSRASGMYMFLTAIAIFLPGKAGVRHRASAVALVGLGLYLCFIGITQRSFQQGIGSFFLRVMYPDWRLVIDFVGTGNNAYLGYPSANFVDSIAAMSAHLYFSDRSDSHLWGAIKALAFAMQPLPASAFEQPVRFGASLSASMGTTGHTGLTTPALAELYFLFGWVFVLLAGVYGWFLRRVDLNLSEGQRTTKYVTLVLVMGGIVVAGHSGLRAFARPTVLAIILMSLSGKSLIFGRWRLSL